MPYIVERHPVVVFSYSSERRKEKRPRPLRKRVIYKKGDRGPPQSTGPIVVTKKAAPEKDSTKAVQHGPSLDRELHRVGMSTARKMSSSLWTISVEEQCTIDVLGCTPSLVEKMQSCELATRTLFILLLVIYTPRLCAALFLLENITMNSYLKNMLLFYKRNDLAKRILC
ncbi:hypothetical protein PROFUN_16653 [Planoprotostelium fungivorum]|uniref:Uncharacterized protein n=1 Tax=Planoprotostelium fungivorum TaxID=1890364 RepID=A0A2P6MPW3_9EUKA|nr:hypothetical protein PROFUN_16653 [Planoprotostelium fungivorum]